MNICFGKEDNEDKGSVVCECFNEGFMVVEVIVKNISKEEIEDLFVKSIVGEIGLLCGGELVGFVGLFDIKFVLEGRVCVEVVEEDDIEFFYDDICREEDRLEVCFVIEVKGFEEF